MPRRKAPKCMRQDSALELTPPVEFSLCEWGGLRVLGMGADQPSEMQAAWYWHADTILPRFIAARPGDRPFCVFALGEVPLPAMIEKPHSYDHGYQTKAGLVHERRVYGGDRGIFEHLRDLDLLSDEEIVAAEHRLESDDPYRYQFASVKAIPREKSHVE